MGFPDQQKSWPVPLTTMKINDYITSCKKPEHKIINLKLHTALFQINGFSLQFVSSCYEIIGISIACII